MKTNNNPQGRKMPWWLMICCLSFLLALSPARAQNNLLVEAEAFVGTDPGPGNGIPILFAPEANTIDITQYVNIDALDPAGNPYTLGVRIKNLQGEWSPTVTSIFSVTAGCSEPEAEFTWTQDAVNATEVDFASITSYTQNSQYEWDMDMDGVTDYTSSTATHDFGAPGWYNVKLTVHNYDYRNELLCSDEIVKSIYVEPSNNNISIAGTLPICQPTGSVDLSLGIGVNHIWSTGELGASITVDRPGLYTVNYQLVSGGPIFSSGPFEVTAQEEITAMSSFAHNQIPAASVPLLFGTNTCRYCYERDAQGNPVLDGSGNLIPLDNGSISIMANGGAPSPDGLYYEWTVNGSIDPQMSGHSRNGQIHTGLSAGTYAVTVMNDLGDNSCSYSEVFVITDQPIGNSDCSGKINVVQFFFDDEDPRIHPDADPFKTLAIAPGDPLDAFTSISSSELSHLSTGSHQLHIRVGEMVSQSSFGIPQRPKITWSFIKSAPFFIEPTPTAPVVRNTQDNLIFGEYFVTSTDDGVGHYVYSQGQIVDVPDLASVDVTRIVDVSSLPMGNYNLNIRLKELDGTWSPTKQISFDIVAQSCTPPVADFNIDQSQGTPGLTLEGEIVTFLDASTASAPNATYEWTVFDASGNAMYTTQNASHTFYNQGVYDVMLTVYNGPSSFHSVMKQVSVQNDANYSQPTNAIVVNGSLEPCFDDPMITLDAPAGTSGWIWSDGTENVSSLTVSEGCYRLSYLDGNGIRHTTPWVEIDRAQELTADIEFLNESGGSGNGSIRINSISGEDGTVYGGGPSGSYSVLFEVRDRDPQAPAPWRTLTWGTDQMWLISDPSLGGSQDIHAEAYRVTITDSRGCSIEVRGNIRNNFTPFTQEIIRAQYWFDDFTGIPAELEPSNEFLQWAMAEFDASQVGSGNLPYINNSFFKGSSIDGTFSVPTDGSGGADPSYNLQPGSHKLHIRVKSENMGTNDPGEWSFTFSKDFYIQPSANTPTPATTGNIQYAEVFRVTDPATYSVLPATDFAPPAPDRPGHQPHRGRPLQEIPAGPPVLGSVPVINGRLEITNTMLGDLGITVDDPASYTPTTYTLGFRVQEHTGNGFEDEILGWSPIEFVTINNIFGCGATAATPTFNANVTSLEACVGEFFNLAIVNQLYDPANGGNSDALANLKIRRPDGTIETGLNSLTFNSFAEADAGIYKVWCDEFLSGTTAYCMSDTAYFDMSVRPEIPSTLGSVIVSDGTATQCVLTGNEVFSISIDDKYKPYFTSVQWKAVHLDQVGQTSYHHSALIQDPTDPWKATPDMTDPVWSTKALKIQVTAFYECDDDQGSNMVLSDTLKMDICPQEPLIYATGSEQKGAIGRFELCGYLADLGEASSLTSLHLEVSRDGFATLTKNYPYSQGRRNSLGSKCEEMAGFLPGVEYCFRFKATYGNPSQTVYSNTLCFTPQDTLCRDDVNYTLENAPFYKAVASWNSPYDPTRIYFRSAGTNNTFIYRNINPASRSASEKVLSLPPGEYEVFLSKNKPQLTPSNGPIASSTTTCVKTIEVLCEDFDYLFAAIPGGPNNNRIRVRKLSGLYEQISVRVIDRSTLTTVRVTGLASRHDIFLPYGDYQIDVVNRHGCTSSKIEYVSFQSPNPSCDILLNTPILHDPANHKYKLEWSIPSTAGIQRYQIRLLTFDGNNWVPVNGIPRVRTYNSNSSVIDYSNSPLIGFIDPESLPNGTYRYYVRAVNSADDCVWSDFQEIVVTGSSAKEKEINPVSEESLGYALYPNPTNDLLYVELSADSEISLRDSKGSLIGTIKGEAGKSNVFDLSSYAEGVYTVSFLDENNQWVHEKVIRY